MRRAISSCIAAGALALAAGCGASVHKTAFDPVTIRADAPAPEPEPEPPPVAGDKIDISEKIHFHEGSARIRRRSYAVLDEVVDVLNRHPDLVIEIQGHTDSVGSERSNRRLSALRSMRVQEYLIDSGVDPNRLTAVGHGEEQPIASNDDRDGRYQNRRVDFLVVGHVEDLDANRAIANYDDEDDLVEEGLDDDSGREGDDG